MGGKSDVVVGSYAKNFVRYIEIAEKVQRYKREVAGLSSVASEDVCGRLFGYSARDLKEEEHRARKELMNSIRETFTEEKPCHVWADGCLFREKEFLESNFVTLLCDASSLSVLRCRSYKRILKRNGNDGMTPRELEREFHKECVVTAEANERKRTGRIQPVETATFRVAKAF